MINFLSDSLNNDNLLMNIFYHFHIIISMNQPLHNNYVLIADMKISVFVGKITIFTNPVAINPSLIDLIISSPR